ncbi:Cleavage stimulation factor subunit 2 [Zalerion maritima]|uniref:Cleavage stimulation factor subunit 2 n=1 Tax=Zalerion maritima TaxID=339359 RepID=A0AAD5RP67_9PEZI|nr:Cleavage stimulation factor subunit 2 [Zalerion maritima]
MSKPPSKVVFVGNIPYGLSEEQISEIFSSAGRVLNFRLVYDKETGRPKGFGFAEYPDTDSAASAVRNLNDHEIMGRKLRVDFSNDGGDDETSNNNHSGPSSYPPANGAVQPPPLVSAPISGTGSGTGSGTLPPLPAGIPLPAGLTCTDAISRTLNTLPPAQLLDILREMKTMATHEPQRAAELLAQAPQLTYAVFQSMLLLGLVSPDAINSVLEGAPQPPSSATPAQDGYPPPSASATPANNPVGGPPGGSGGATLGGQDLSDNPEALMKAVMELPQETIDMLPEEERNQIMQLRHTYLSQAH